MKCTKKLVRLLLKINAKIVIGLSELLIETLKILDQNIFQAAHFDIQKQNIEYQKKINQYNKLGKYTFNQMFNEQYINIKNYQNEVYNNENEMYPPYFLKVNKNWGNRNENEKRIAYFRNFLKRQKIKVTYFLFLVNWYRIVKNYLVTKISFNNEDFIKRVNVIIRVKIKNGTYERDEKLLVEFTDEDISKISNPFLKNLLIVLKNPDPSYDIIREKFQKWTTGSIYVDYEIRILEETRQRRDNQPYESHTCSNRLDVWAVNFENVNEDLKNHMLSEDFIKEQIIAGAGLDIIRD